MRFPSVVHSSNTASLCSDSLHPCSLSSGRIPDGMSSHTTVTSVPPTASTKLAINLNGTIWRTALPSCRYPPEFFPEDAQPLDTSAIFKSRALARRKSMHHSRHTRRRQPSGHSLRIQKRLIHILPPSSDHPRNPRAPFLHPRFRHTLRSQTAVLPTTPRPNNPPKTPQILTFLSLLSFDFPAIYETIECWGD